jgi:hypothetical protein
MKRLLKAQAKHMGFVGPRYSGEVITRIEGVFITSTQQRQQGYATADTFAYLVVGNYKNGDIKLQKHPGIKGTKGYRAIGG